MADPKKEQAPHALEDLLGRAGKNNPKMLQAILAGTTNEALVESGGEIATPRLLVDGLRLYGEALDFFDRATAAQKRSLRGVSRALVEVAIHHLDHLRRVQDENEVDAKGKSMSRVVSDQDVLDATAQAARMRDQAYSSMKDAAGGNTALIKALDTAYENVEPASKLAKGVQDMAALLLEWLTSGDAMLRLRLDVGNLDKEFAGELAEAALALQTALAGAAAKSSPKAARHAQDREDGVQIILLGQIVRAFENGHDRDATIPRLVPISTRRLFNRNKKSSSKTPAEPPPAP